MKPIIYSSTDDKAPQLNITAGSLRVILKACLMTGYGSKAAAGWEMVYEDAVTNKMAIRSKNITSLKNVLLINDNVAAYATVTAYNDWDSGTNVGIVQFTNGYFIKGYNGATVPNWILFASDKFFYLFIQTDVKSYILNMFGFGDAISLKKDKSYSVCLCASSGTNHSGYTTIPTQLNIAAYFPKPPFNNNGAAWGARSAYTSANTQVLIFSKFVLFVDIDSSGSSGTKAQPILQLYGMLMPYGSDVASASEVSGHQIINDQLPFKNTIYGIYQNYAGRVYIHTDDWGE